MITGMALDPTARNSFSGGTLAMLNGGDDVTDNLLGADRSFSAAGNFFGSEFDGNPAEVGGVFASTSPSDVGEIYGGFLAD